MSITPQAQTLLTHLESGGTLTQRSAHIDFNVGSLTKRMSELRDAGWNIVGSWETNHKSGQRFMRYSLGNPQRVAVRDAAAEGFDKYVVVTNQLTLKAGDELMLLEINGVDIHEAIRRGDCGVLYPPALAAAVDQHGRCLCTVVENQKEDGENHLELDFNGTTQWLSPRGLDYKFARKENGK